MGQHIGAQLPRLFCRCDFSDSRNMHGRGGQDVKILDDENRECRVRKLTEGECFRLQGVKDEDYAKIRENHSKSACYHLAGDSICTSVLMAIFGQMLGLDYEAKIKELTKELSKGRKNGRD